LILVTGGAGYVGAHAVLALQEAGEEVIILDSLVTGHDSVAKQLGAQLVVGDIRNRVVLKSVFDSHPIDAVMHFAAHASVAESQRDPALYWDNNVVGTLNLVEGMIDAEIDKIVFSSSCTVYGIPESEGPIDDSMFQSPISTYGWTKFAAEQVMKSFEKSHGLRSVALRYFNAAGADPEGRLGEHHDPETHLIPNTLAVAAGRSPELGITGFTHATPDGTCIRDYVHVSDLASAHLLGLDYLRKGGPSQSLNLGSGTGASVLDVVKTVEAVSGNPVPYRDIGPRDGDPAKLVSTIGSAEQILGWKPQRSDLHDIISDAWAWDQKLHAG